MTTCHTPIKTYAARATAMAALSIASALPMAAQATSVFDGASFNATGNNHTFSNGLVSVNFDYDRGNGLRSTVEQIDQGVFFDQVRRSGQGQQTTFTFNQLMSSFSGLWNLAYRSDGSFERGDSDGLFLRAYNGTASVFDGCLVGSNNRRVADCAHVDRRTETAQFGISGNSGVSFDRVVVSLYSGSSEAYSLSNLNVTTAVPEPRPHLLLLAGLGAIAFIGRRRKND